MKIGFLKKATGYFSEKYLALGVAATTLPGAASAAGGIGGIAGSLKTTLQSVGSLIIYGGFVAGLFMIGAGGWLLYQKGDSERGEDIKGSRIAFMFVGAAVCLAISYMGTVMVETIGGGSSDVGK
jgi:hypothetical protein